MSQFKRLLLNPNFIPQTVLAFFAILTLYPFYFMVMTSLKTNEQFFTHFWSFTFPLHFENYSQVFSRVMAFVINSLMYSIPTLLLVLALSLLAGYAFARFRFFGKEPLFLAMLALMMLPAILTLIPLFVQIRDWGWLNTRHGVILPWTSFQVVFATYIMRVFFERLPEEMFEAARLDGANELRSFFSIALPLALPGLGTIAILNLLFTWNDVIWPLVALLERDMYPIAAGILAFRGQYGTQFGPLFAGYTLASIPLVVFFAFTVRQFIQGMKGGFSV